jgi:hypothetical protein
MERSQERNCSYRGDIYDNDSQVCRDERCIICNDGEWKSVTFPPIFTGI